MSLKPPVFAREVFCEEFTECLRVIPFFRDGADRCLLSEA
jgi:hypothetical protein